MNWFPLEATNRNSHLFNWFAREFLCATCYCYDKRSLVWFLIKSSALKKKSCIYLCCMQGEIPANVNQHMPVIYLHIFYFLSYTDFLQLIPPPLLVQSQKEGVFNMPLQSCQSICILTPIRRTNHREAYPPSGVQRSAGRKERKKAARRAANTVDTAAEKADWNNQSKGLTLRLFLSLSLCMSLSLLQSVSSFLFSSLVLFYLWLPLKSLRLLHTFVVHKSGTEKDSGQEEREMENRREAFTVIWATVWRPTREL